ncbi:glycosyl transferase family 1 [Roseibium hamelinense]|uniref:Glycosyl transferase family 1 n=1 Tax=Roseibium hamelinense TaxID=150831 RepID=A0A562T1Q8_9HYPH|nr:glycosyltransferase family 4 protein [Roseibium hamelinense]TWI87088.1 glycosyl transferase family 1 [Roseibium hamelinense]
MADPVQNRLVFAYPGDIDTPTGGYGYDRRVIAGLRQAGWQVDLLPLGDGFPFPSIETAEAAATLLNTVPLDTALVVDGLAYGVLPAAVETLSRRRSVVALVHHPLCQENGLGTKEAESFKASENEALRHAAHVIVTSSATAAQVGALFAVAKECISVVEPGTDRPDPALKRPCQVVRLLSVGTIVPRKGYDLLFSALTEHSDKAWHLDVVGDTTRDKAYYADLLRLLEETGLSDRVTFHGSVDESLLGSFYSSADVFVLASRYEGYGMAYTEALAHGLPVVGSGGGAVPDTLSVEGATYCGVEDVCLLSDALEQLINNETFRVRQASLARAASSALPTWENAAKRFGEVVSRVCLDEIA